MIRVKEREQAKQVFVFQIYRCRREHYLVLGNPSQELSESPSTGLTIAHVVRLVEDNHVEQVAIICALMQEFRKLPRAGAPVPSVCLLWVPGSRWPCRLVASNPGS